MLDINKNHITYGLIMSLIVVICLTIMEITGQNESFYKSPLVAVWTIIAPAIVWFLGIRAHKKTLKNKLTFKEGVKEGFKISLVFAITSPFVFAAYYLLINQPILSTVAVSYGLDAENTNLALIMDMLIQFVSAVIFGTIYAAILSFFLKTK